MDQSAFLTHIRGFTNFVDPTVQSDTKLMGWVRMAESHLNERLRIADMVQIDEAVIVDNRVSGPPDFISADLVVDLSTGKPYDYQERDQFYTNGKPSGQYTQSGKYLIFGGTISDTASKSVELHYFGDVPPLVNVETWLTGRRLSLMTSATLAIAFAAMEQDDDALKWETATSNSIQSLNDQYRWSIGSGGRLKRKIQGFG